MTKTNRITSVETIRGLAALAVCIYHFAHSNLIFAGATIWYPQLASCGWLGVEAFFVLSGFVIPYSLIGNGYQLYQFPKFFIKRCLRIEPPYLMSILVVLLLNYLSSLSPSFSGTPFKLDLIQILLHFAYLTEHLGYRWLQPVYWTLEAEFHFYIIIGLCLPLIIKNNWGIYLFFAIGLALSLYIPLNVFKFMPLFIIGIGTCLFMKKYIKWFELIPLLITCTIFILLTKQEIASAIVAVSTALLICFTNIRSKVTDFLGKISFSLYLIHIPLGSKILNLGSRYANSNIKIYAVLITAFVITITASWLFYTFVELPALNWSKKIVYTPKHIA